MKNLLFGAAALALLAGVPAWATPPGNQGGGQGGCGVGQHTNGCGSQGGEGGAGGQGGDATGVGIGVGIGIAGAEANAGAVAISGPSTSTAVNGPNTNLNTLNAGDNRATATAGPSTSSATGGRADANATLGNLNSFGGDAAVVGSGNSSNTNVDVNHVTGINGQQQTVRDSGNSSSSSGSSSNSDVTNSGNSANMVATNISVAPVGSGNSTTVGGQTASNAASNTVNVAGDTYISEAQKRAPVASAYAAPLAIGGGVCAYTPVSGAGQFVSFGLSGSGAKIDKGCETRATADMFARMGLNYEACLIMVSQPAAVRAGLKAEVCDRTLPVLVSSDISPSMSVAPVPVAPLPPLPPAPEAAGERG